MTDDADRYDGNDLKYRSITERAIIFWGYMGIGFR